MFSTKYIFAATAALSLISSSAALYDAGSKSNVALYWGSGANQQDLRTFCDESSVDIIPIGFINVFPGQGDGLIGENFGNKCYGDQYYPGADGNPSKLPTRCPTVQDDIPYCQSIGKKILLSLGGASETYALSGIAEGIELADFLWGAYGPLTPEWVAGGGLRPLDRGLYNTDASVVIDIDGFDFDIEYTSTDQQAGYIACIDRLRQNFQQNKAKTYIISGAPQCPMLAQNGFEDANMGHMIQSSTFDVLWIQFYNNGQAGCTARNWADANANYPATQSSSITLNYQAWKNFINSGASIGAKIYLGLLAGPVTSCTTPTGYGDFLNATEADHLISAFQGDAQFGGVMLWEATSALNDCDCGTPYFDVIKNSLNGISPPKQCTTVTSSTMSSTSSSSSSTSASIPTTSSSLASSSSSISVSTSSSSSQAPSSSASSTSSSSISQTPSSSASSSVGSTSSSASSSAIQTTSSSVSSVANSTSSLSTQSTTSSSSIALNPTTSSSASISQIISSSSSSTQASSSSSSTFLTLPPYSNSTTKIISTSSTVVSDTSSSLTTSSFVKPSGSSSISGVSSTGPSGTSSTEAPLTTSTVYTTSVYTITSCAATVTDCPARIGSVTTEVISLYTTICPVTQAQGNGGSPAGPTGTTMSSSPSSSSSVTKYTTSTVYTTKVYTVTSCAPEVTNCPARIGKVTTETIALYTTVCPVANETPGLSVPVVSAPGVLPSSSAVVPTPPAGGKGSNPPASSSIATLYTNTFTTYVTLKLATPSSSIVTVPQSAASNLGVVSIVASTVSVVPIPPTSPAAPYPTGPSSKNYVQGTGTGLPSVSLVFTKQAEVSPVPSTSTVVKGQSATSTPSATPVPSQFTGAAGRVGGSFGVVCAIFLGAVAILL